MFNVKAVKTVSECAAHVTVDVHVRGFTENIDETYSSRGCALESTRMSDIKRN